MVISFRFLRRGGRRSRGRGGEEWRVGKMERSKAVGRRRRRNGGEKKKKIYNIFKILYIKFQFYPHNFMRKKLNF